MLTGRFEVGKDDHPEGLTYEEVELLVKTRLHDSPLSLQFRILPDLSALKQDSFGLQPYTKNGVWYYNILYSLSCYSSLKYIGSGPTGMYENYVTGSPLWSISAKYGYDIPENEAVPNSNARFFRKGRSVYYRTEQPGKKYELQSVEIKGRSKDLENFLLFFAELNTRFAQVSTWIDQKLDATVWCECGHSGKIDHLKLLDKLKRIDTIDALRSGLRCTSCQENAAVTIMPAYGVHTPKAYVHNTAWVESRRPRRELPEVTRNCELAEMYNNLGGDGESSVYLSDGAYLAPNGEILED